MRADVLVAVGHALYGERWKSALADDLGVTYRTLHRWVMDDACPGRLLVDLRKVVGVRARGITEARKLLWSERSAS